MNTTQITLSENQLLQVLLRHFKYADNEEIIALMANTFGGSCRYDSFNNIYCFTPNSKYSGELDDVSEIK